MAKRKTKKASAYEERWIDERSKSEMINQRYKDSRDYLLNYYDKWQNFYQLYRSVTNNGFQNYRGRANLFIPYAYSTVETVIPRLTANQPKVIVSPRRPVDLSGASNNQVLIDYYWQKMRMKSVYKNWVKDGLIYGTGVLKLVWKDDGVYDGPHAEVADLAGSAVYFDPTNPNINDPKNWWIHEYEETIEDIKNNPNYDLPVMMSESEEEGMSGEALGDYYKNFRQFLTGKTPGEDRSKKVGKIRECWYWDGNESRLLVQLNGQYIIRDEKNPYSHGRPPFVAWTDVALPHEPLGIGEIEPIESLQYELNDVRNQRMDNVTQILHRMWKVHKGADIDTSELVWRPNGLVFTDIMEGIDVIDVPDVTRSAYNEETLIKGDMQVASGVTDYTRGVGSSQGTQANETARGIMLMQEVANARFQLKLDNIEDALVIFGEMLLANIQQYMPEDMVIRIIKNRGVQWKRLSKKEIQGQYDTVIEMGATQPMNKEVRRANARELIATVAPYLQMMPDGVNKMNKYLKFLEETYDLGELEEEGPPQPLAPPTPQASTPGQAGPELAAMEQIFGGQGAALGGAPAGQRAPELRGLV